MNKDQAPNRSRQGDWNPALGVTLSGLMLSLGGPLTRLSQRELAVARLIAQGLSLTETSAALQVELDAARGLVGRVLRKLALRSPGQLVDAWPQLGAVAASESAEILDAVGPAAAHAIAACEARFGAVRGNRLPSRARSDRLSGTAPALVVWSGT